MVAIDFGTTYSGFAFSFIKDQGKDAIFMNKDWINEQGSRTSKTPTCLLLRPDLSFDSFGYEAIEKYAGLEDESEEKEYLFFKHFKMALHSDEVRYSWNPQKTILIHLNCLWLIVIMIITDFSEHLKHLKLQLYSEGEELTIHYREY